MSSFVERFQSGVEEEELELEAASARGTAKLASVAVRKLVCLIERAMLRAIKVERRERRKKGEKN